MAFKFGRYIKEEITGDSLKDFLKKHKMPSTYKKEDLFSKIEKELNEENPKFTEEDVINFVNHEIKYGKRRHLFFSSFSITDSRKISSLRNIKAAFRNLGIEDDSILSFNDLNKNEGNRFSEEKKKTYIWEYLELKKENNSIKKIELCFTIFNEFTLKTEEKDEIKTHTKEFIWVEIDPAARYICVRLHPPKQEAFGQNHSAIVAYNTIVDIIYRAFDITKTDLTDFNETLYDIFKDITDVSEKPFRDKVSKHIEIVAPFLKEIKQREVFENAESEELFKERVIDLLERVVIQENFSSYLGYAEGKDGVLNKMQFTDETGASVNASSGTKEGNRLELSDVFFDTRKTIEKKQSLDTLWIDWFKIVKDVEPIVPMRISTKFDSSTLYYLIHFQRIHLSEEVESFVFSKLTKYSGVRWRK